MEQRPGHLPLAVVHPAYLRLARVQPGQRLYLGLDWLVHLGQMRKGSDPGLMLSLGLDVVLHPGQRPYLGLERVLHPGEMPYLGLERVLYPCQRPYRLAWPHLPQLPVRSGTEKCAPRSQVRPAEELPRLE